MATVCIQVPSEDPISRLPFEALRQLVGRAALLGTPDGELVPVVILAFALSPSTAPQPGLWIEVADGG